MRSVADSVDSPEAQSHSSAGSGEPDPPEGGLPRRADALASRERILAAAAALVGDRRTSMAEIAAAAGVGRATLYRHFPTRQALVQAQAKNASNASPRDASHESPCASEPSGRFVTPSLQPPGQLGRSRPLALEVTHILDEVPPHLIADQLVAETRRIAGVPVALYIVDLDGSQLVRLVECQATLAVLMSLRRRGLLVLVLRQWMYRRMRRAWVAWSGWSVPASVKYRSARNCASMRFSQEA